MAQDKKRYLGIKAKLILLLTCLLVLSTLILGAVAFLSMSKAYTKAVLEIQEGFDTKIRTAVENIVGVLEVNHQRYLDGALTQQEEMKNAEEIVRNTRYDGGEGYFWADLADGTCVVHMNPSNEGAQRYDFQDTHGTYYIRDILQAGSSGNGGFTEFYYNKPGETTDIKKRAFTLFFEPYGWYISTGNYYDDIDASVAAIEKDKQNAQLAIGGSCLLICVAGILLSYRFAKKIADPITKVTGRLTLLSGGDVQTEPSPVSKSMDEAGRLTKAAESVILQIRGIIDDISEQLQRISEGDMTAPVPYQYIGDYIPILESIQQIRHSLNTTLLTIEGSTRQVSSSATQISAMSQALASGASEQSASIESLSGSIGTVSHSSVENAEEAARVSGEVNDTVESIHLSQLEMEKMLASMSTINSAANEISHITSLIESIAFQTNILALNAAIEAAKAGSYGRGFAVVAEEVRALAGKSSEAAQQTAQLILSAQKAVSEGSVISRSMSEKIGDSVRKMQQTKVAIHKIGVTSEEQAKAVQRISESINQISAVVQSNAATAQESSAFSQELSEQASILYQELEKFKLSRFD